MKYSLKGQVYASSTISVSTKSAIEICRALNRKKFMSAKKTLENIINEKESLNGKYHTKTAEQIMEVLNSAEANAKAKNFDLNAAELFLSANKGITIHRARRKRDFGSRLKMTNIQVVLREKVK